MDLEKQNLQNPNTDNVVDEITNSSIIQGLVASLKNEVQEKRTPKVVATTDATIKMASRRTIKELGDLISENETKLGKMDAKIKANYNDASTWLKDAPILIEKFTKEFNDASFELLRNEENTKVGMEHLIEFHKETIKELERKLANNEFSGTFSDKFNIAQAKLIIKRDRKIKDVQDRWIDWSHNLIEKTKDMEVKQRELMSRITILKDELDKAINRATMTVEQMDTGEVKEMVDKIKDNSKDLDSYFDNDAELRAEKAGMEELMQEVG